MIKRTIEISQQSAHLAVRQGQLVLCPKKQTDTENKVTEPVLATRGVRARLSEATQCHAAIPCEDIGVLVVDNPGVTYSHAALAALIEADAAVVLCGRNHLPAGLILPMSEHSEVVTRIKTQLSAKKPLLKRIWRQIIQAKVRAQAYNLLPNTSSRSKLLALARLVRSGDPENIEAQAAKTYWGAWRDQFSAHSNICGSEFRRDPDGPPPNNLLNYGYAILRAAVARAIVVAGLMPALGIHHRHRSNIFCLADDLVEPLRPLVDDRVAELVIQGETEMSQETKQGLLELLTLEVGIGQQTGPLMVALHRYVASLVKCYDGSAEKLEIPVRQEQAS